MEYEEVVKKIVDIKRPEWDDLYRALLNNYREYYHNDISLRKGLVSRAGRPDLEYHYTFTLRLEALTEINRNLLGIDGKLLDISKKSYDIANICIDFQPNAYNRNMYILNIHQEFLPSWCYSIPKSKSEWTTWFGENIILMRKINTLKWYSYNSLLEIDITNLYKNLNNYKILEAETNYHILTGSELTHYLRSIEPYWNGTTLYALLNDQDLLLMKSNDTREDYKRIYIAIPDSQIQWNDYELMWVFEFYAR